MNLKLIKKVINNNNKTNQIKTDCDLQLYENEIIPSCFTCNQYIDRNFQLPQKMMSDPNFYIHKKLIAQYD